MDLGCGTGILCQILQNSGIRASGMDFSSGMIEIARKGNPQIQYDVADMITYCPDTQFDLVTCTGDALNHIRGLSNIGQIFRNVYHYTSSGGYFIFDILNEEQRKEVINTLESACPEKSVPTTYKSLSVDENKLMGAFLALPPEEQQSQLLALVRLGTEKLRKRRQEMF
jgi:predicted TPR repeat methyltransferase